MIQNFVQIVYFKHFASLPKLFYFKNQHRFLRTEKKLTVLFTYTCGSLKGEF